MILYRTVEFPLILEVFSWKSSTMRHFLRFSSRHTGFEALLRNENTSKINRNWKTWFSLRQFDKESCCQACFRNPDGTEQTKNVQVKKKCCKLIFGGSTFATGQPPNWQKPLTFTVFYCIWWNDSTLTSCASELRRSFRTSRHVFHIRIDRSRDWEAR